MLSLYEILKASKTGIAPDMWTALAGMNWGGADSGHEVKELTGIPPLSFTADGTPLLDYLISGNMSQTGTPTPSNPVDVNGVGVRTENLFPLDATKLHIGCIESDGTIDHEVGTITVRTNRVTYQADTAWRGFYTDYIHADGNEQLTFSPNQGSTMSLACNCYDENNNFLGRASIQYAGPIINFTTRAGTKKVRISVTSSYTTYTITNPMLNTGSTALPYEPYGYKIPISSGQQTTNIYLGSTQTVRAIKKLVLDGTENWTLSSYPNTFYTTDFTDYLRELDTNLSLCSHYRTIEQVQGASFITDGVMSWYGRTNVSRLYIGDVRFSTAAELQTYLGQQYAAGTPIVVWYVLTTPETAAVNEPLMKIGDYADTVSMEQAGVQIPTLHGNTVIDVETELKPSQMYIKYQK
jgi:hypothetical protein